MMDGDLFDKLAFMGSELRKAKEPFGGIQVHIFLIFIRVISQASRRQVIVTGDFFQLPPVAKHGATVKFAFEADLWDKTIKKSYNLTKVFRQNDQGTCAVSWEGRIVMDAEFVDMLNEMRFGRLSDKSIAKFKALSREIVYEDGLSATELFVLSLYLQWYFTPVCSEQVSASRRCRPIKFYANLSIALKRIPV
jgi:ATP-dependent DNA helicase PIF1